MVRPLSNTARRALGALCADEQLVIITLHDAPDAAPWLACVGERQGRRLWTLPMPIYRLLQREGYFTHVGPGWTIASDTYRQEHRPTVKAYTTLGLDTPTPADAPPPLTAMVASENPRILLALRLELGSVYTTEALESFAPILAEKIAAGVTPHIRLVAGTWQSGEHAYRLYRPDPEPIWRCVYLDPRALDAGANLNVAISPGLGHAAQVERAMLVLTDEGDQTVEALRLALRVPYTAYEGFIIAGRRPVGSARLIWPCDEALVAAAHEAGVTHQPLAGYRLFGVDPLWLDVWEGAVAAGHQVYGIWSVLRWSHVAFFEDFRDLVSLFALLEARRAEIEAEARARETAQQARRHEGEEYDVGY